MLDFPRVALGQIAYGPLKILHCQGRGELGMEGGCVHGQPANDGGLLLGRLLDQVSRGMDALIMSATW